MNTDGFDFDGLILIATISTLIAALGAGIDKLLRDSQRNAISERILRWWEQVERIEAPNIVPTMSRWFIQAEQLVFGSRIISVRWIATTIVVSATLTTCAILIGDHVYTGRSWSDTLRWFPNYFPIFTLPANYFFDFCTLGLTVVIMRTITTSGSFKASSLILLDMLMASIFAVSAYILIFDVLTIRAIPTSLSIFSCCPLDLNVDRIQTVFQYYLGDTSEYFWPFRLLDEIPTPMAGAASEGGWFDRHPAWKGRMARSWFANTSLIPTIAYLLLLLLIIASTATVKGVRWVLLHLFALDIETDKSIFLYSGVLIGLIATSIKLVVELSNWWFEL